MNGNLDFLIEIILVILLVYIAYKIFTIPISIAKCRHLSSNDVCLIRILTWCGLLCGITWFIAFVIALTFSRKD
ncbi:hypothetical protein SAMN02910357_00638 [Succinivibrio dextrinosolvens]|nr:hypothetical protein SAMN02910357_00638 [Succinivibrio dextrinosolvens]